MYGKIHPPKYNIKLQFYTWICLVDTINLLSLVVNYMIYERM